MSGVDVEKVEYTEESRIVRTLFDETKTTPSMAVIATLADVMDADPVELDALHSSIDPEALDGLIQGRSGRSGDIHVTFKHEGYDIRVHSYGVISVMLPENDQPTVNTGEERKDDV